MVSMHVEFVVPPAVPDKHDMRIAYANIVLTYRLILNLWPTPSQSYEVEATAPIHGSVELRKISTQYQAPRYTLDGG